MIIRLPSNQNADSPLPAVPGGGKTSYLPLAISLVLFILVGGVFSGAVRNGFVNYDDNDYVSANYHVQQGLCPNAMFWAFSSSEAANWHPVTWLSHAFDWDLYGANPFGPHLTNVLLHAANTALLFVVLYWLTGALWRGAFAAALFGVHPAHVESVAWISERKDVLSAFFFLVTLLAYVNYAAAARTGGKRRALFYWLALAFFLLGLLSKPMLVTVPFVLLLLDYWPLHRLAIRPEGAESTASETGPWKAVIREKIPYFALSALSCLVTYLVQRQGGAMRGLAGLAVAARLQNAAVAYCRYLGELFYPARLAVYYPYPAAGHWPGLAVAGAVILLVTVSVVVIWLGRGRGYLPVGWFWFLGTLVPVIGLVQVGVQSMADRYTYIPSIGLFIAIVWGLTDVSLATAFGRMALLTASGVSVLVLSGLSIAQIVYWRDGESLFRRVLAVTPEDCVSRYHLGDALFKKGRLDEAAGEFQAAIKLNPNYANPHNDLGTVFSQRGQPDQAVAEFKTAIQAQPDYPAAHYNLGKAMDSMGRVDDAIREFREAIRLKPSDADAHKNLAVALAEAGKPDDAMAESKRAAALNPQDDGIHLNLGVLYGRTGDFASAIREFQTAAALNPRSVAAHNYLGIAFRGGELLDQAVAEFRRALELQPGNLVAHENLGELLDLKGQPNLAAVEFDTAIRISPKPAADHYRLGLVLVKLNQREDAAAHFREALRLQPGYPGAAEQLKALSASAAAGKP